MFIHFKAMAWLTAIAGIGLQVSRSDGAVLAFYDFRTNTSSVAGNTGVNAKAAGGGNTNYSSTTGTLYINSGKINTPDTQANAYSSGTYVSIKLNPTDPSKILNLGEFSFDGWVQSTASSNVTFYVETSVNGFGADKAIAWVSAATANSTDASQLTGITVKVDLSDSRFQNLQNVEIRIYAAAQAANFNFLRFDNIQVTGEVAAVPEPAAVILLGIMGWSLLMRRPLNRRSA